MRTLTALALATAMIFSVANAQATTHKKKHHHAASTKSGSKNATKPETEKAPATK